MIPKIGEQFSVHHVLEYEIMRLWEENKPRLSNYTRIAKLIAGLDPESISRHDCTRCNAIWSALTRRVEGLEGPRGEGLRRGPSSNLTGALSGPIRLDCNLWPPRARNFHIRLALPPSNNFRLLRRSVPSSETLRSARIDRVRIESQYLRELSKARYEFQRLRRRREWRRSLSKNFSGNLYRTKRRRWK